MCHGDRDWHRSVIRAVRRLNEEKGFAVAVMMDTEGSEIHMGELGGAPSAKAEVNYLFSPLFFALSQRLGSLVCTPFLGYVATDNWLVERVGVGVRVRLAPSREKSDL